MAGIISAGMMGGLRCTEHGSSYSVCTYFVQSTEYVYEYFVLRCVWSALGER